MGGRVFHLERGGEKGQGCEEHPNHSPKPTMEEQKRENKKPEGSKGGSKGGDLCPTCGLTWAQCVEFGFCGTPGWRLTRP